MELCTTRAFSNLHHRTLFIPLANRLRWKITSIPFKPSLISRTTISEGSSSGADQYIGEERDVVFVMEDIPATEENVYNEATPTEAPKEDSQVEEQTFDSEDPYSILLFDTGASTLECHGSLGSVQSTCIKLGKSERSKKENLKEKIQRQVR
ncbi:hypothetical protein PVL29_023202 [Vitis rotundifolia]|uniref:Uncharacterized protein n=1 Tax=Vitis rotundifolia TaxID=103349 RepID=A0AA38YN83_VITRO|nr:hypothetical protein PVL29_023202 [Vitis rotundifolia]